MEPKPKPGLGTLAALLPLVLASSCGREPLGRITLEILVPLGQDPFAGARFIRLSIDGEDGREWPLEPGQPVDAGFEVEPDGEEHQLVVEGLDASRAVTARGVSPPVVFEPGLDVVFRVLARAVGSFSMSRHPLTASRLDFAAVAGPNGDVFALAGVGPGSELVLGTERFDPYLTEAREGPPLPAGRRGPAAVVASDWTILLLSGGREDVHALRPGAGAWEAPSVIGPPLPAAWRAAVCETGIDRWVLAGGELPGGGASAQVVEVRWNGISVEAVPVAELLVPRDRPTATALEDGRVLVAGGSDELLAEWLDGTPVQGTPRRNHAAVDVGDGEVLILGGATTALTVVVHGAPARDAGSMAYHRTGPTATRLGSGAVLVVGGAGDDGAAASAEVLERTADGWLSARVVALSIGRTGHRAVEIAGGNVLAIGGVGATGAFVAFGDVYTP